MTKVHGNLLLALRVISGSTLVAISLPFLLLLPAMFCAAAPLISVLGVFYGVRHGVKHLCAAPSEQTPVKPEEGDAGDTTLEGHRHNVVAVTITAMAAPVVLLMLVPILSFLLPVTATAGTIGAVSSQLLIIPLSILGAVLIATATLLIIPFRHGVPLLRQLGC